MTGMVTPEEENLGIEPEEAAMATDIQDPLEDDEEPTVHDLTRALRQRFRDTGVINDVTVSKITSRHGTGLSIRRQNPLNVRTYGCHSWQAAWNQAHMLNTVDVIPLERKGFHE